MVSVRLIVFVLFCVCIAGASESFAQSACTRTDLQAAVDAYLAAQRSGNPAALSLAAAAKYIENTTATPFDKGILKTALKIDFSRSLLDTEICETFTEVIVTDFISDSEIGAVVGFIRWPSGVPDSHVFRVENGKLRFVHSLTVCTVPNCGFPQRPPADRK